MSETPVDLSEFNVQATIDFFEFLPRTETEIQAIRFLHKCVDLGMGSESNTKTEQGSFINDVAIEKIRLRYELYKLHTDYFFPKGYEADHDSLSIAIICDEYTGDINEPLQPPEPPEGWFNDNDNFLRRHDGFTNEDSIEYAYAIWEKATELTGDGLQDDEPLPAPEIFFLAHINAMQSLREIQGRLESYDNDGLADILQSDIRSIRSFALPQTALGAELLELADQVEDSILPLMILEQRELPHNGLKVVATEPSSPEPQ